MYTLNKDGSVSENVPQVIDIQGIINEKDQLDQNIKALQDDLADQTAKRDALVQKLADIAKAIPSVAPDISVVPEVAAILAAPVDVAATPVTI